VAKEDRGFASMDRSKQREIASKGGKAAHQKGTAHEWTSEEARRRPQAESPAIAGVGNRPAGLEGDSRASEFEPGPMRRDDQPEGPVE
jgi:general stress protein YciG